MGVLAMYRTAPKPGPLYPGRFIRPGEPDLRLVRTVQQRLNNVGCGRLVVNGILGGQTVAAVRLFQARHTDAGGVPLKIDGILGPITWGALFPEAMPILGPASPSLGTRALAIAAREIDVEVTGIGSRVGEYLRSVGKAASGETPWATAFVYWCFQRAAKRLGVKNPLPVTNSPIVLWKEARRAGVPLIAGDSARRDPAILRPGMVFVIETGAGTGHAGLVERIEGGKLVTIEGDVAAAGNQVIGVRRRGGASGRAVGAINRGFLDFAAS